MRYKFMSCVLARVCVHTYVRACIDKELRVHVSVCVRTCM